MLDNESSFENFLADDFNVTIPPLMTLFCRMPPKIGRGERNERIGPATIPEQKETPECGVPTGWYFWVVGSVGQKNRFESEPSTHMESAFS